MRNAAETEQLSPEETVRRALSSLSGLTGLNSVKRRIAEIANRIAMDRRRTGPGGGPPRKMHFTFEGNPGTGKTTVARLMGEVLFGLGVTATAHVHEVSATGDLIGSYLGQTAPKVENEIDNALGGVLFIDEAYALAGGGRFNKEALDVLVRRMENDAGKFVLIAAGYSLEMQRFIESNPGFDRRFSERLHFEDYTADELVTMFHLAIKKRDVILNEGVEAAIHGLFTAQVRAEQAAGGRFTKNAGAIDPLVEKILDRQAMRLATLEKDRSLTPADISLVTLEDLPQFDADAAGLRS
jgi:SpoVK/Ycf46/Vps4 family AAA+-type ATPase